LTGLGNRRQLEAHFHRWEQTVGKARLTTDGNAAVSLLMVDADHFKRVNDRWGHHEGDRVLVALAKTLLQCVRRDDVVIRHGGEEFIVFLPDAAAAAAQRVSAKAHQGVQSIRPGGESPLTVSIGITTRHDPSASVPLDVLIQEADQALYAAKQQGRNRSVMASSLHHCAEVNGASA
jgi:sigma-B regulation protein RsbU (phosphoserine phosphatase)